VLLGAVGECKPTVCQHLTLRDPTGIEVCVARFRLSRGVPVPWKWNTSRRPYPCVASVRGGGILADLGGGTRRDRIAVAIPGTYCALAEDDITRSDDATAGTPTTPEPALHSPCHRVALSEAWRGPPGAACTGPEHRVRE
jgi:hypothetical protein